MKPLAHLAGFSLAVVLAALGSGCSSSPSSATYRQPAQDFEVVESSAKRPLTDTEMAEVRSSVASYLDREGATDSGDYFLKVYLTPEDVDAESEWVVVRFTRYTTQRVALVSAYTYDGLGYSPYYAYDIYPYGYGCVSRISFQYYVDPFYNRRYYHYPRYGYGGPKGGGRPGHHHGGNPGNPPGNNNGPGPNSPHGPKYTETRPGLPQNRPVDGEYRGTQARRTNPGGRDPNLAQNQGGNRGESRPASAGDANSSGRPGVPPPPRTTPSRQNANANPQNYAANPAPAPQRPANSASAPQGRNRPEGAPGQHRAGNPNRTEARREQPGNRPAPNYRPAAQQPARNAQPARSPQPSRMSQPAPARESAPAHQPDRSAPASRDRQGSDNQREALR